MPDIDVLFKKRAEFDLNYPGFTEPVKIVYSPERYDAATHDRFMRDRGESTTEELRACFLHLVNDWNLTRKNDKGAQVKLPINDTVLGGLPLALLMDALKGISRDIVSRKNASGSTAGSDQAAEPEPLHDSTSSFAPAEG